MLFQVSPERSQIVGRTQYMGRKGVLGTSTKVGKFGVAWLNICAGSNVKIKHLLLDNTNFNTATFTIYTCVN